MTLTLNSILEKRYRIDKKLGQGGFGVTYQAADSRLNAHCAV
jgi:serine/threonine protein kinase